MKKKEKLLQRQEIPVVSAHPEEGLTGAQVQQREAGGWRNGAPKSAGRSEKEILLENLITFFNLVFVVMAVVLAFAGSSVKNMTFLIIVFINAAIGCYQEIRAKRAVDKLTLVAAQQLRTIRDGKKLLIRSDLLVRDDIVEYVSGDQICADGILRSGQLQVNESLITGEADAIVKNAGDELKHEIGITVADMRSGNYEAALTRFESRVGSSMLSDVTRGLIGVLRGDETEVYWSGLAVKFSDYQRQVLKQQAQKVPSKVKRLSMCLRFCFMLIYIAVIGMEIVNSIGILFG